MENGIIASLLCAAEGKIVGRIRLQKIIYLLEQLGLNSGFAFSYHHYGPYSEDLSQTLMFDKFFEKSIIEKTGKTNFGAEFSIFTLAENYNESPTLVGALDFNAVKESVSKMKSTTSVVIELAATIHWLKEKEKITDWNSELKKRKASKATPQNVEKAVSLLSSINL